MSSIFTKIIKGEIPCYKVAETAEFLAFLDIRPLTKGHTLVIPKQEVDYIFDLDSASFANLHVFSKQVAEAIKKAIPCVRVGVCVMGLEVPHAHIHLIPFNTMEEMNFANPKHNLEPSEMNHIAEIIAVQMKAV
ncbi:MAG: HIT family protein [Bacteroidetes bacterium B1(2017)]|nr:MAG: HIT family protein [Bacteroidetes bacterium B1(2017)]